MSIIQCVSVETPYHSIIPIELRKNIAYAILCTKHATRVHNEAPYASHLIHPQTVSDQGFIEYASDTHSDKYGVGRDRILEITNVLRKKCDKFVFYMDRGFSYGMRQALDLAIKNNIPYEYRNLSSGELLLLDKVI